MSNTLLALQITALGMGLVFAALILLWWMIHLLTALTAEKDNSSRHTAPVSGTPHVALVLDKEFKARAAAVAVAIALAELEASSAYSQPTPPATIVSAWQQVMRTRQMYQKGVPIRRQPR